MATLEYALANPKDSTFPDFSKTNEWWPMRFESWQPKRIIANDKFYVTWEDQEKTIYIDKINQSETVWEIGWYYAYDTRTGYESLDPLPLGADLGIRMRIEDSSPTPTTLYSTGSQFFSPSRPKDPATKAVGIRTMTLSSVVFPTVAVAINLSPVVLPLKVKMEYYLTERLDPFMNRTYSYNCITLERT